MKLSSVMFTFNLKETIVQINENAKKSAAYSYVVMKVNPIDDTEISIEHVCVLAVKYPIMFYPIERFRKHFRRVLFGDKFWSGRKVLKTNFKENFAHLRKRGAEVYADEDTAIRETARSIISDFQVLSRQNQVLLSKRAAFDLSTIEDSEHKVYHGTEHPRYHTVPKHTDISIPITSTIPEERIMSIDPLTAKLMKEDLGYKLAKELIRESQLEIHESQKLHELPEPLADDEEEQRIFDKGVEREFVYNTATGTRAWVDPYVDEDGDIVKEITHRITPLKPD